MVLSKNDYANQLKILKENNGLNPKEAVTPAKHQSKKKLNWKYQAAINKRLEPLLPAPPYAIGIDKDLFASLATSGGSKTKLRQAIRRRLYYLTSKNSYQELLKNGVERNSIDSQDLNI